MIVGRKNGWYNRMALNEDKTGCIVKFPENDKEIDLRDPFIAGVLAWFVPGLGHLYQKRYAKAFLFFICIMSTLLVGIWMGSYWQKPVVPDIPNGLPKQELQLGRNIYFSWRPGDKRLFFLPQALVGSVATVALIQAKYVGGGNDPFFYSIFAPPRLGDDQKYEQPTLNSSIENLHSWFDIGVLFTVVAGLMNALAIFDAVGGPVWMPPEKEKNDDNNDNKGETSPQTESNS